MPPTPMRNSERVLAALGDLSEAVKPHDLRVGQAIANAILIEFGPSTELARLFYVDDDVFADVITKYVVHLRATTTEVQVSQDPKSQREHSVRRMRVSTETGDRIATWTSVSMLATLILAFGWLAPPLTRYVVVFVALVLAQVGFLSMALRLGVRGPAEGDPPARRSWAKVTPWVIGCVGVELAIALGLRVLVGRVFG